MTDSQRPPKVGGWTDNEGEIRVPFSQKESPNKSKKSKQPQPKKEFDPRTDKMFDINSSEDYLMESLHNFKPPVEKSVDRSISVFGDKKEAVGPEVIAGVKMRNMVEDHPDDINEIKELQDPNFQLAAQEDPMRMT